MATRKLGRVFDAPAKLLKTRYFASGYVHTSGHGVIRGFNRVDPPDSKAPLPGWNTPHSAGHQDWHVGAISSIHRAATSPIQSSQDAGRFGWDHQKFSICHTFLGPPASAMASNRPSGDGMAAQISGLLDLSRTGVLPSSVTFSNALSSSKLCQETRRLFPSGDQSRPINPSHPLTFTSRVLPVDVERKWIFPSLAPKTMIPRCEPSGDKPQLQSGSICGGSVLLPLLTSNLNVRQVFPFALPYRQIVDGKRAHCTFQMPTSFRTKRGVPPPMGIAKMEEGFAELADLGVEIYKISEPSGVTLGCESWSALLTRLSAMG